MVWEPQFAVAVATASPLTLYYVMTLTTLRFRIAAVLLALITVATAAPEPEIIVKARAHLAPEAVLDSVQSIQYRGTLTTDDGKKVAIEIIFQKPAQHRVSTLGPETTEITALDDSEGWQRVQDSKDPSRWNMNLLGRDQIRRLRANTFENLNFLRTSTFRGDFKDLGIVEIAGRQARKLAYTHSAEIVFTRYLDLETGKLLLTETERGGTIKEEGEMIAGGIRFPKRMITSSRMADGKERSVTIEFEKISVNERFAASLFTVPMMTR